MSIIKWITSKNSEDNTKSTTTFSTVVKESENTPTHNDNLFKILKFAKSNIVSKTSHHFNSQGYTTFPLLEIELIMVSFMMSCQSINMLIKGLLIPRNKKRSIKRQR